MSDRARLVKLVRDDLGEHLSTSEVSYAEILDEHEAVIELRKKLVEESIEYIMDPCLEELADIYEVVRALAMIDLGLSGGIMDVQDQAASKYHDRGGFYKLVGMYVWTGADERHG